MSETKPPRTVTIPILRPEYASYLDCVLGVTKGGNVPVQGTFQHAAMLELQQLREQAAKYQEAMRLLSDIEGKHDRECPWSGFDAYDPDLGLKLSGKWYKQGEEPVCECPVGKAERFIEAEIAAGRFTP